MMTKPRALLLVLAVLVLVACANPLRHTDWNLTRAGDRPAHGGGTIAFTGDRFDGYTGCNAFSGRYRADAQTFTISELSVQEASCPTPELSEQERAVISVLESVRRYKADEQRLVVMGRDGVLVFER